jgi:hypothetical protein
MPGKRVEPPAKVGERLVVSKVETGLHAHPFRGRGHRAAASGFADATTNTAPTYRLLHAGATHALTHRALHTAAGATNRALHTAATYRLLHAGAASAFANRSLHLSPSPLRPLGGHRRPPCGVSLTRLSRVRSLRGAASLLREAHNGLCAPVRKIAHWTRCATELSRQPMLECAPARVMTTRVHRQPDIARHVSRGERRVSKVVLPSSLSARSRLCV